jgi:hypothetical protein
MTPRMERLNRLVEECFCVWRVLQLRATCRFWLEVCALAKVARLPRVYREGAPMEDSVGRIDGS